MYDPPMDPSTRALRDLTRTLRASFQALRQTSDEMNADLGVTASMRAVMEAIRDAPRTVPDIAREKRVTRQHIQAGVDALAASGLILRQRNPANARSWLIGLSRKGQALFQTIQTREALAMRRLSDGLSAGDLEAAERTLRTLIARIDGAAR